MHAFSLKYFCLRLCILSFAALGAVSCSRHPPLFSLLPSSSTGVFFQNRVAPEDSSFNVLDYIYYYNGGGVAAGDINNDGLPDLYFTASNGADKLYVNEGNFHFQDVTASAGFEGNGEWHTGVTMVDVNADGWLDIYVCAVGRYKQLKGRNKLYINNRDLTFTESAAQYGLDISALSTQVTFVDYDKDRDLDMFLVCHSVHSTESFRDAKERMFNSEESGDKLFLNEQETGRLHFREVTSQAGIYNSATGYGLNVIAGDFNNDNWDDLYISNDFHENDYYYINNRDGSFKEVNQQAFPHQSRFSMGSDAADVNNDGWLDLVTLDMLPANEQVLKSSTGDDPLDIYRYKMNFGYNHQYSRNCLQLNVGGGNYFSDIALYANVAATDWSWSVLAADFNNDGIKDLFVSNGIVKRPNDLDYIKFVSDPAFLKALSAGKTADRDAIALMPSGAVPDYILEGSEDLRFTDRSQEWGFTRPSLSNGAAYADLDNDGDLDLIINNINSEAMLCRNNARQLSDESYLAVQLEGTAFNPFAIGAKVMLKANGKVQLNYLSSSRGFMSASSGVIHFGLGKHTVADTLEVIWPSGKVSRLTGISANQRLTLSERDAAFAGSLLLPANEGEHAFFTDVTSTVNLNWKHQENNFTDFNIQPLMPRMVSTEGPKLAVADINHDGLEDFFVCGARDQQGRLFVQDRHGKFVSSQEITFAVDSMAEDVNAYFFDANGDEHPDLYVVTGGNEFWGEEKVLSDRLYINNGKGGFTKSDGLPLFYGNKSVAVAADIDHDGDQDLFVGGRVISRRYGEIPASYLLLNNGKGNFSIAPDARAPGLSKVGMVTDAVWTDTDLDGWQDLVIVGEWMPVTLFHNDRGRLVNITEREGLEKTAGLWLSVLAVDIDGNGFPDLLAGNRGENSKLSASERHPLKLYVGDLDGNGNADQLLTVSKEGNDYSFANKEELEKHFPSIIRKRYETYSAMAGKTAAEIFGKRLDRMKLLTANTLASVVIWNSGKRLSPEKLPAVLQLFPVFSWLAPDFSGAGKTTILAAGNFYGVTPFEGRYDAGYGQVLIYDNNRWLTPSPFISGFRINGEARSLKQLHRKGQAPLLLVGRNNDSLSIFTTGKR